MRYKFDSGTFRLRDILGQLISSVFLVAIIGFFVALMLHLSEAPETDTALWTATEARIEASAVERLPGQDQLQFRPVVRYSYPWTTADQPAKVLHSDQIQIPGLVFEDYTAAFLVIKDRLPGSAVRAYVNPANPAEAVLQHAVTSKRSQFRTLATIIALAGIALFVKIWLPETPLTARMWGALICLILIGVGTWCTWVMTSPFFSYFKSGLRWKETPCTVLESQVHHQSRIEKNEVWHEYRPRIFYEYQFGGTLYRSTRYSLADTYSRQQSGAASILARYPPGKTAVCFVNPQQPWESMLRHEIGWSLLQILFPVPLVVGGVFFFFRSLFYPFSGSVRGTWTRSVDNSNLD